MLTRRAFAALSAIGAAALHAAPAAAQSAKRAEVEALRRFAEATHPRGREAAADADWRARWEALAAEADGLSEGQYFVRTRRALGWFKDGHTAPLPFEFIGGPPAGSDFALALPLRARAFHDGAYVTAVAGAAMPLLGARITRVGGMESGALIRAIAEQWPGNDAWAHRWAGSHFSSPALLQGMGAVRQASAPITIEGERNGRRVRVQLTPGAPAQLQEFERPRTPAEAWRAEAGFANFVRIEGGALYIGCAEMADLEGKSFLEFTRDCFAAMAARPLDRLVLDLRRNGGGNNYLPEALRKRILRSPFNRPGGLYILTSPFTFSAAQNPATRLERDSFAIFAGEPTGGAPNHYGDAQPFAGAASGITSIVSTIPWFDSYPSDQRAWIMPDLPAPETFADWRAGRDGALEAALAHVSAEEADEATRARIFFFRRPSQEAPWRPFWREA
ncbi:MAG TPA: hypothetical protein PLK37_01725 [Terricaulis sp.]|nr:hypothetical protein [Terricaulis sp.]